MHDCTLITVYSGPVGGIVLFLKVYFKACDWLAYCWGLQEVTFLVEIERTLEFEALFVWHCSSCTTAPTLDNFLEMGERILHVCYLVNFSVIVSEWTLAQPPTGLLNFKVQVFWLLSGQCYMITQGFRILNTLLNRKKTVFTFPLCIILLFLSALHFLKPIINPLSLTHLNHWLLSHHMLRE